MLKVKSRRVEPIVIEFEDEQIICTINVDALIIFKDEFGDLEKLSDETKNSPYEISARLLYAGVKPNKLDFTFDEAKVIACSAGFELLDMLTNALVKCCGDVGGEEFTKKYIQKLEEMSKNMK